MKRFLSRLETRVTLIVAAFAIVSMMLGFYILSREFASGQFGIEERSLAAQAEEWAEHVEVGSNGEIRFDPPRPAPEIIEAPYTGFIEGSKPLYGYAVFSDRGDRLLASTSLQTQIALPAPATGATELFTEPDFSTGENLLIANTDLSIDGYYLRVSRRNDDQAALANTFFTQASEEFLWIVLFILASVVIAAFITIRISFSGLREIADAAAAIDVDTLGSSRLSEKQAPTELQSLINAFNRTLERLEAGVAAQKDFSVHAAHELRTPLADMKVRLDGDLDQDDKMALSSDVDHMTRLVGQLLNVARLRGAASIPLSTIDLCQFAEQACAEFGGDLVKSGRDISYNRAGSSSNLVQANDAVLRMVIRNLFENAIEHTPQGTSVSVTSVEGALIIEDDGPGLSDQDMIVAFNRFWRADRSGRKGSGLGLSICLNAMDALGGTITLERSSMGGCRFTLSFVDEPCA